MAESEILAQLATTSGPLGTLVLALGFLVRGWFGRVEARLASIEARLDAVDTAGVVRDQTMARRVDMLEVRQAADRSSPLPVS